MLKTMLPFSSNALHKADWNRKKLLIWYSLIEFYAKNKNLKIEN